MGKGLAYSSTEKTLITELVQKHYIVENKKTDSTSIHEKIMHGKKLLKNLIQWAIIQ